MARNLLRIVLTVASAAGSVSCRHSDSTGPSAAPQPNFVQFQSDNGDVVGAGRTYRFTHTNALITLQASANHLAVRVTGEEEWLGDFEGPSTLQKLKPGEYTGLQTWPFHDPAKGGQRWVRNGQSCNGTGTLTIDSLTYIGSALTSLDLHFEQHCSGSAAALRGTVHWRSDDTTSGPGPIKPVPSTLWRPPAGATPPSGTYVYLQSDSGDPVGFGKTYTYVEPGSAMFVANAGNFASFTINAGPGWIGRFIAMNTVQQLQVGYYPDLHRMPHHNPVKGGIDWFSLSGGGCNELDGWFAVDRVSYALDRLTAFDVRFEIHCDGRTAAFRGEVHWNG